jgi:hypothetical protein
MKVGKQLKSQCRNCNRETNHTVTALEVNSFSSQYFDFSDSFAIVKCLGCDTFSFRKEYTDSESFQYDDEGFPENEITIGVYPSTIDGHTPLNHIHSLPPDIKRMYQESIDALAAGCKVLAGVGFRAIIEAVCLEKRISGNLETKINNLSKKGFITKNECNRLHSIRFIGNDSVHEMKVPKDESLRLVLQIVEHLLSNLYIIDAQAKDKLEGIINEYGDFKLRLLHLARNLDVGKEYCISEIFGKEFRRIKDDYTSFEQELTKEVQAGDIKPLTLGAIKSRPDSKGNIQHFVLTHRPVHRGRLFLPPVPPPPPPSDSAEAS